MLTTTDPYQEAALVYTRLARELSREAGDALDQIRAEFGSHAALRAALIIMLLRLEIEHNRWIPYFGLYVHLLEDYAAAIPLAREAATYAIQALVLSELQRGGWAELPIS